MITTVLEFWNNQWWRWYLKDGKPYAFVKAGEQSDFAVRCETTDKCICNHGNCVWPNEH